MFNVTKGLKWIKSPSPYGDSLVSVSLKTFNLSSFG